MLRTPLQSTSVISAPASCAAPSPASLWCRHLRTVLTVHRLAQGEQAEPCFSGPGSGLPRGCTSIAGTLDLHACMRPTTCDVKGASWGLLVPVVRCRAALPCHGQLMPHNRSRPSMQADDHLQTCLHLRCHSNLSASLSCCSVPPVVQ